MPHPTSPDPAGLLGRTLDGRYQAIELIGEGDLGFVYRGEQTVLRRPCALKVLRPAVSRDRARLQRVMQGSQQAAHLQLAALALPDEILTTAEGTTFVLPWLHGEDLGEGLRQSHGRLPWPDLRGLLVQIGVTLSELHAAGVSYPGLKPSNLFLVRGNDGNPAVKLLDVGLSRHDPANATIAYMAPEWIAGAEPDARTDVYSLAVLAYQALTGKPAFEGPPEQIALMKRVKPVRPLQGVVSDLAIPASVEALLMRCLERDPNARPVMASFLDIIDRPAASSEEGVTGFFRRSAPLPPPQRGQVRELPDESTGQFRRSPARAAMPSVADPAPSEATRISTPLDRARISAPPVQADDRTAVSAPAVHPSEATRVAIARPSRPPAEPAQAPALRPAKPAVAAAPAPVLRPSHSPAEPARVDRASQRRPLADPPRAQPSSPSQPPIESTRALTPIDEPATEKLPLHERTSVLKIPGRPSQGTDMDLRNGRTSETAVMPGFGGSVLIEAGDGPPAYGAAMVAKAAPPSRRWALWDRLMHRLHRAAPTTGQPRKPGLWARLRGVRATNLPARRGPTGFDKFLRRLAEIPGYIGRAWRLALKPMGRLISMRSKLSTPLLALRSAFGRVARMFSRWTGGA